NNPITLANPGPQATYDGAQINLSSTASDETGGTLTFSATYLPTGLSIAPSTGIISGTVSYSKTGSNSYFPVITATDGTYSASQSFSWNIYSIPVANSDSYGVPAGVTINVDATFGVLANDTN